MLVLQYCMGTVGSCRELFRSKGIPMNRSGGTFSFVIRALFLVIFIAVVLEIVSLPLLSVLRGDRYSRAMIRESLDASLHEDIPENTRSRQKSPGYMLDHVLHPYLGYVYNREVDRHVVNGRVVALPVNTFGFFGDELPKSRAGNRVTVAITGGSAALDLFLVSRNTLVEELGKSPTFADVDIHVVSLALGGMKQPQQLIALSFMLAIGRFPDIVVNFDGFNEIALPFSENTPVGVSPLFPRNWRMYASKTVDIETTVKIAAIVKSRERIERWREIVSRPLFRRSGFMLTLWHVLSVREKSKWMAVEEEIRDGLVLKEDLSFQEAGPCYEGATVQEILEDSAELWRSSSVQMWKVCEANGIAYFHFLQPNQHLSGSKPLTEWEKRFAIAGPGFPHRVSVENGYPVLIENGREMRKAGVPFFDLTAFFKDVSETVYSDACCHYNRGGNDRIAVEIADSITRSLPRKRGR